MKHDNSQSLLLKLPAELRNWIYEEVLLDLKPIDICNPAGPPIWHAPAVLQTCRTIRDEAKAIHYGGNIFLLPMVRREAIEANLKYLKPWLQEIGAEQSSLLQRVYLDDLFYSDWDMARNA